MTFDYMSMIATLILMSDIYPAETSRCANMNVRGRFTVTERQTRELRSGQFTGLHDVGGSVTCERCTHNYTHITLP